VTPEELGRSQALAFEKGTDKLSISTDGEHLALSSFAPLEPDPSELGTRAVFSRSSGGWRMTSAIPPRGGAFEYELMFTSPDMSLLGFEVAEPYSHFHALEVGLVGGPHTRITNEPEEDTGGLGRRDEDGFQVCAHVRGLSVGVGVLCGTDRRCDHRSYGWWSWC